MFQTLFMRPERTPGRCSTLLSSKPLNATGETVRLDVSTRFTVENGVVMEGHDHG